MNNSINCMFNGYKSKVKISDSLSRRKGIYFFFSDLMKLFSYRRFVDIGKEAPNSSKHNLSEINRRIASKIVDGKKNIIKTSSTLMISRSLAVITVLIFLLISWRLIDLQIVEGYKYREMADNNGMRKVEIVPPRGLIFDRNGELLAYNVAKFKVNIQVNKFLDRGLIDESELADFVSKIQPELKNEWTQYTGVSSVEESDLLGFIRSKIEKYIYYSDLTVVTNLSNEEAIEIKTKIGSNNGVSVVEYYEREYKEPEVFSHLIGFVSRASAEDIERADYLNPNDYTGKIGIERSYDKELFGEKGVGYYEYNAKAQKLSDTAKIVKEPKRSSDLYLSIDAKKQRVLYNKLKEYTDRTGGTGGAAVIMNVDNGEVEALVSYPGYDTNLFVKGISASKYAEYSNSEMLPLFNRAIGAQQPPGSTFKPIVALAAIDNGFITRNTYYFSSSGYKFSNGAPFSEFGKVGYGWIDLYTALEVSSNIYFCEVVRKSDYYKIVDSFDKLGIGKKTGIKLLGEAPGRLPSPQNKYSLATTTSPWLDEVWYPEGDACNSAIGQGITLITPIQGAMYAGMISNGGKKNTPVLLKDSIAESIQVDLNNSAYEVVKGGMIYVVTGPRKYLGFLSETGRSFGSKTGTAEYGKLNERGEYETTHAWNIGFYTDGTKNYSYSILLEGGGYGNTSARVMRDAVLEF